MKLITHFISRLKQFFHKMFYFGFFVAFWDLLDSQKKWMGRLGDTINKKKHEAISVWLRRRFHYFISDFSEKLILSVPNSLASPIPPFIWVCWWDGITEAPDIVKACLNSIGKNAGAYKVQLITKDNFHKFCFIPDHILKKFAVGLISKTHFSDILRMALLSEHGGIWLDATMLVTGTIHQKNMPFFTIKREYGGESVSRQRWTGFCIGGQRNTIVFEFVKFLFFEFWKKYNSLIDYFLIDYAIAVAYDCISSIKKTIDEVPLNNRHLYTMQNNLGHAFDPEIGALITGDTIFNKLTWKEQYPTHTENDKLTVYGYILEKYGGGSIRQE